jgi:general secretion pathway protein D
VQVEFSQVTGTIEQQGQVQPIIGTRQIQTVIRLRDGETNMMAGLIQRESNDATSGVAGISDIPGMRHIFGKTTLDSTDTDIIMTLTPRIVRIPDFTEQDLATLWVGTEDNMQLRGPARDAYGRSPFAPASEVTVSVAPVMNSADDEAGGSVNRIVDRPPSEQSTRAQQAEAQRGNRAGGNRSEARGSQPAGGEGAVPAGQEEVGSSGAAPPGDSPTGSEAEEAPGPTAPSGPAAVRLVPSKTVYSVGEQVQVDVVIENATNVASTPFHLRYNRNVLEYVSGAAGAFMQQDGKQPVFLAAPIPQGGDVVVGLSRVGGGSGVAGSGQLASFVFRAIAPGDAGFAFSGASVKDSRARNLPAQFGTVPVQVQQ